MSCETRSNGRSFSRRATRSNLTISGLPLHGSAAAESGPSAVRVGALVSLETLEREHIARVIAQSPSLEAVADSRDRRDDTAAEAQTIRVVVKT